MIVMLLVIHKLIHVCFIWMILVVSTGSKGLASQLILALMTQSRMVVVVMDHVRKDGIEVGMLLTRARTTEDRTCLGMYQSRTSRRAWSFVEHRSTRGEECRVKIHACAEHRRMFWWRWY